MHVAQHVAELPQHLHGILTRHHVVRRIEIDGHQAVAYFVDELLHGRAVRNRKTALRLHGEAKSFRPSHLSQSTRSIDTFLPRRVAMRIACDDHRRADGLRDLHRRLRVFLRVAHVESRPLVEAVAIDAGALQVVIFQRIGNHLQQFGRIRQLDGIEMPVIAAHAVQFNVFITDPCDVIHAFKETALVVQQCRAADFHASFLLLKNYNQ